MHLLGKTGSGKSTLLYNLMRSDFERGRGFALLDPHGDLAHAVADATPSARVKDTIYLDPLDTHVVSYNPLIDIDPLHRATVASHVVSSFKHIWASNWGPRLEYILTNAVRLLLDNNGTLKDIPRLLVDTPYRTQLLKHCSDDFVRLFWTVEYAGYNDRLRAEAIAPIQNKAGTFANNPILRAVIGAPSTIDLRGIMDTGKVLLCNLSKRMGAEPSHLLGALLTTGFAQAAMARHDQEEEDRVDFTLYVDEFQNYATESFSHILSEARKYRLNLVLANQFMHQVPELLRYAVVGNTGTLVVFRIGSVDAPLFSKELGIPERILIDLPNYHARVRTMIDGSPSAARYIETLPADISTGGYQSVLNTTRTRYARERGG
jgi:type IV secretory pathway TraG/TraD family ATPase VirD4